MQAFSLQLVGEVLQYISGQTLECSVSGMMIQGCMKRRKVY